MEQHEEPAGPDASLEAPPFFADPAGAPTASAPNSAFSPAGPAAEAMLQQQMTGLEPDSSWKGPAQGNASPEDLAGSLSAPVADLHLREPGRCTQDADRPAAGPARADGLGKPSGLELGCPPQQASQTRPAAGSQPHAPVGGLDPGDPLLRRAQEALSAQLAAARLRLEAELREKRKALNVRNRTPGLMLPARGCDSLG